METWLSDVETVVNLILGSYNYTRFYEAFESELPFHE